MTQARFETRPDVDFWPEDWDLGKEWGNKETVMDEEGVGAGEEEEGLEDEVE